VGESRPVHCERGREKKKKVKERDPFPSISVYCSSSPRTPSEKRKGERVSDSGVSSFLGSALWRHHRSADHSPSRERGGRERGKKFPQSLSLRALDFGIFFEGAVGKWGEKEGRRDRSASGTGEICPILSGKVCSVRCSSMDQKGELHPAARLVPSVQAKGRILVRPSLLSAVGSAPVLASFLFPKNREGRKKKGGRCLTARLFRFAIHFRWSKRGKEVSSFYIAEERHLGSEFRRRGTIWGPLHSAPSNGKGKEVFLHALVIWLVPQVTQVGGSRPRRRHRHHRLLQHRDGGREKDPWRPLFHLTKNLDRRGGEKLKNSGGVGGGGKEKEISYNSIIPSIFFNCHLRHQYLRRRLKIREGKKGKNLPGIWPPSSFSSCRHPTWKFDVEREGREKKEGIRG